MDLNDFEIKTDAFSYSRKSPDDKEDTDRSINNQDELNETICKGKGWNLIAKFSDKNISGGDRERKGLNDCISQARKHKVSNPKNNVYIIVKDQDRFARDSSFLRDTLKDLTAYGVYVFSIIKGNFLDADDLGDSVGALMNEQLIIQGRKKALLTRDKKIEKRLPCIPAPFGYKYNKQKNWSIEKNKVQIIIKVLEDYINNINYKQTLAELQISRTKRDRIISNAKRGLYNGTISFDNKIKGKGKEIIRIEKIEYSGTYEPIISEELFNACQNR